MCAIITLTVIPSERELVAGIPLNVTLTTNLPSIIFYTLDGTEPTASSDVYVEPIDLPTQNPSVNLRVLATDGVNTDATINLKYSPDWSNARLPHSKVTILSPASSGWCGSRGSPQEVLYSQPASYTVDQFGVPNKESDGFGYDPSVFPVRGSDEPIPLFDLKYSESNSKGETGDGIGTLPKVTVVYTPPPPEESDSNKATFNPRALVIFQDNRDENENDYSINKQFYESQNFEKYNYGSSYSDSFTSGRSTPHGSLLRYLYNEREHTITFYYRDSLTNQWIISTEPFDPHSIQRNSTQPMGRYVMPNVGNNRVFKWLLFKRTAII